MILTALTLLAMLRFVLAAAPLPGAHRMRAVLDQRARLIPVDGGGHGIFGLVDNVCATQTLADYLASG